MIFDALVNLKKYTLIPHLTDILAFLEKMEVGQLREGDIQIKGEDLYAKVLKFIPKKSSENYFETHENYTDLQIVLKGRELMQYAGRGDIKATDEFSMEGDFKFYKAEDNISELVVLENQFAIFFPGEAHRPGCLYRPSDTEVLKVVFKIKSN